MQRPTKNTAPRKGEHRTPAPQGTYYITRGEVKVEGFGSFYQAYMYALNRFGSEDFLVRQEGW